MTYHRKKQGRKSKVFHRRTPPGTVPGTLVTDPVAPFPEIHVMAWSEEEQVEQIVDRPGDVVPFLQKWPVCWVNVDGLGDNRTLQELADIFHIHHLALEDVVHVHQRSKVEEYDRNLFVVARMVQVSEGGLTTEQLSLFLGDGYLVSFQERKGDCLDPVRERIRGNKGRIRRSGADYLAYAVLDAVVDAWFPVLEEYGERLEGLEETILLRPDYTTVSTIHRVKRDLLDMRRTVWPTRETVNSLIREEDRVKAETRLYLRDCYDHVIQVIDMVESYRDMASGLMDFYLSSVSNRMNEVMKVLTIIATIFIPLTFIAGIYGMNFNPEASPWNMPELNWRYGYVTVWGLMLILAGGMVYLFRRRGWLGALKRKDNSEDQLPGAR